LQDIDLLIGVRKLYRSAVVSIQCSEHSNCLSHSLPLHAQYATAQAHKKRKNNIFSSAGTTQWKWHELQSSKDG